MEPVPADVLAAPASGWAGGGDLEAELAEIGAQLEAVAAVRDDLRAAVQRMDGLTRQVQSDLLGVHRRQEGAVQQEVQKAQMRFLMQQAVQKARESVPKLQAAYAELAAIIARRPGEFYRFSDHWRSQNHTVVSQLAFAHWLDSGTLLSHKQLEEQLQLRAASFSIDLEDYLTGLCGLSNEFYPPMLAIPPPCALLPSHCCSCVVSPRSVMSRVTEGDCACNPQWRLSVPSTALCDEQGNHAVPRVAAALLSNLFVASLQGIMLSREWRPAFLNDLFAAFRKLNLRNDMLRKRFDGAWVDGAMYKYDRKRKKVEKVVHEVQINRGIKYDLKKVEEVVYDVEIRGLAKTAAEPMQDA
ncbi:unnamed protein product [Closterium sp. NIES-64]|nr:unnamed protein product [Closterium sp. NIES-64]